ncbi:hypothetical protein AB0C74_17375 [Spirillospora sp. NPDC048832]|jgi:hypothetical protein
MRALSNRALLLFSVMLALFQVGVVAASADESTWTVTDGGRTDAYGLFAAQDMTTGSFASCHDTSMIVRFRNGTGLSGTGLIMITYGSLGDCTGNAGVELAIHPRGLPWKMDATSYDPQTGTTTGTLTSDDAAGISAVVNVDFIGCEVKIGGPGTDKGVIQTTYKNTTGELTFSGGNLVVTSVSSGCSLVDVGDPIMLQGYYTVSPVPTISSS